MVFLFCVNIALKTNVHVHVAYEATMKTMIITATAVAVIPTILGFFLPNWYLGDTQNAVDKANLEGEVEGTARK